MSASMSGKTVLITGATNGIGLAAAMALAGQGAQLLLHGRDAARGRAAIEAIRSKVPDARAEFLNADFAVLSDVRALAEEVLRRAPKLDVLVNNAGAIYAKRSLTRDGFEATFAVNHLAPFYLTHLLLDRLKASAPARIVTVASEAHRSGRMNFDDLNSAKRYTALAAYGQSKLANILFTRALAKRLDGTGVTANCLHPGVVRTGFGANNKGLFGGVLAIARNFFIPAEEGAKTSIYLASAPEVAQMSGLYFDKCKPATPTPAAQDDADAERLWAVSAKMVGLG